MAENKGKILIDSSIAVATLTEEDERAMKFVADLNEPLLLDFTHIEVTNVLRHKNLDIEVIYDLTARLREAPYKTIVTDDYDLVVACHLSQECDTTVYDALYHSVALKYDYTYYTKDKQYYKKANKLGNIELLP